MELNKARFYNIVCEDAETKHQRYNIGTYKEKELHIILKKYFEPDSAYHEIKTNGFIADIRKDNVITEIETSGFSGLKPKLNAYLPEYKVILVYPLAEVKYISWIDPETSEISQRKKSPKKVGIYDLLFEMVYILPYIKDKNLSFVSPRLEIDEYRLLCGWSKDRKRGSVKYERMPTDIFGFIEFCSDKDFLAAIPAVCEEGFTVREFATAAKIQLRRAYGVVKVLAERGVIFKDGKKGRADFYRIIKNETKTILN